MTPAAAAIGGGNGPSLGAMILGISSLGTILEIACAVSWRPPPVSAPRNRQRCDPSWTGPVPARVSLLVAWGNGGRASGRLLVLLSAGRAGACVPGRDSRNLPR